MQARTTAILAALIALAGALAIAPLAFGDDAASNATDGVSTADAQAAAEVREQVADVNEEALEAPPAVGGSCDATLDVEGIGDTCVTPGGLLRVEQADGRSHTIHGLDAPPAAAASYSPGAQSAVANAGADDVACVEASQPHYVLVYARPGNVSSRYAAIAPKLRTEIYKLSAFEDAESRSVDPQASKRLPMRCEGGAPLVLDAALSGLSSGSASFSNIVDGFRAIGYEYNGDGSGNARYIVYYDSPSPSGAAGTGHVFTTDASATAGNQNNKGGLYAIEYRYADGGGVPHWDVLAHEVIHTMGAVINGAAHASGMGHCTDGQDVMCYADGSSAPYDPGACGAKLLDCGRDDYFNPSPPAGSYLATHWNVAAGYNRFLLHEAATDTSAPTDPTSLQQTGASNTAIGVGWSPSSDGRAVSAYVVSIREPGGAWRDAVTTSRRTATVSGLAAMSAYEVGVTARDTAGNLSGRTTLAVATNDQVDLVAPGAPVGVAVRTSGRTATFTWNDAPDNVGVASYELRRVVTPNAAAARRELRSAGTTPETTITIPLGGLTPGQRYEFEVVARDDAANVSPASTVRVMVGGGDRSKPTAPARLRVVARTGSSATVGWNPSRDNVGVVKYHFFQKIGRRWVKRTSLAASKRQLKIVQLKRGTTYSFRLQAVDRAGNASPPSRPVVVRVR